MTAATSMIVADSSGSMAVPASAPAADLSSAPGGTPTVSAPVSSVAAAPAASLGQLGPSFVLSPSAPPPTSDKGGKGGVSAGLIAGVVAGAVVVILILGPCLFSSMCT